MTTERSDYEYTQSLSHLHLSVAPGAGIDPHATLTWEDGPGKIDLTLPQLRWLGEVYIKIAMQAYPDNIK